MIPEWPYNLPLWRRRLRLSSPDSERTAEIDHAVEVSMGNPTSGTLVVSGGLRLEHCNPSFIWSDDSRYLAVSQFYRVAGLLRRQRLLVADVMERRVYKSRRSAWYFQPESFLAGHLTATANLPHDSVRVEWRIPGDLHRNFGQISVAWAESEAV